MAERERIIERLAPELADLTRRVEREGGGHEAFMELGLQLVLVEAVMMLMEEKRDAGQ